MPYTRPKKLILSLGFFCLSAWAADLSRAHYPMLQTSTGDRDVQINVLMPRLKDYRFVARAVNGQGPEHIAKFIGGPQQDPGKILHEKSFQILFSGLEPNTEYQLEMSEVGYENTLTLRDERRFKTLSSKDQSPLKLITVSCMNDEIHYEPVRQNLWNKAIEQSPDAFILLGDQTYVDSFDYVVRGAATAFDVWTRHFRSFSENPLMRSYQLVPAYSTWDDHDTGIDNGNANTPSVAEARRAFLALYGGVSLPGFVEKTERGVQSLVTLKGQNLFLLDARSFRTIHTDDGRYSHLGQEQEEWFFDRASKSTGPLLLFKGDMWGSPTITRPSPDGKPAKRITESFFGDHPKNYGAFMANLFSLKKPFAFFSGDIHFSEVSQYGPKFQGTSYQAPFNTAEITSSPMHSFIFFPKPGEEILWPNISRAVGVKDYNFVTVETSPLKNSSFKISAVSWGQATQPLFKYELDVTCEKTLL
jgi:phosphodiesterase/alkaline phosphatase D-like protein